MLNQKRLSKRVSKIAEMKNVGNSITRFPSKRVKNMMKTSPPQSIMSGKEKESMKIRMLVARTL